VTGGQSEDDDDDLSDTEASERKERKEIRASQTESMLERILEGQSRMEATLVSIQEEFIEYRDRTDRKLIEMSERQESLENALTGMERKLNYMERKQREKLTTGRCCGKLSRGLLRNIAWNT
jgi:predicted nucleic acid-binding protein